MKNIQDLNYSELVGLINERNRPSGGIRTVQEVTINARVDSQSKVLEIGSNTGFTSVNINLLTGANVVGIDVNAESVTKAKQYANEMRAKTVDFIHGDALKLPFANESFDMVWCSNVTSFIDDKKTAVSEYLRVLKPNGILAIIPIYYRVAPPEELIEEISEAINCKIEVWDKMFWIDLFKNICNDTGSALEVFYEKDYKYLDQSGRIDKYVDEILSQNLSDSLKNSPDYALIKERASYFYELFNENNYKYAGYSTILMQKRKTVDEVELFLTEEA